MALAVKAVAKARFAAPVALLLCGALALTACGSIDRAGAAAVIDGRVVSESDVQTAATQTNEGAEGLQQPFTASTTLPWLIISPYILAAAEKSGHGVSESQAAAALPKLTDPSPATVDFVRTYIAAQSLTQADSQAVLAEIAKATITVNPRYGRYDPKSPTQLTKVTPSWIKTVPGSTPTPSPSASTPSDGSTP